MRAAQAKITNGHFTGRAKIAADEWLRASATPSSSAQSTVL
jgi:hypothetical protein